MKINDLVSYIGTSAQGLKEGDLGTLVQFRDDKKAWVKFDALKPSFLVGMEDITLYIGPNPKIQIDHVGCGQCENIKECVRTGCEKQGNSINHPSHYNSHPSGIECIEIVRHMTFNIGNAIKYMWRCDHKNALIEDLEKAKWYIEDEIKRLKQQEK